MVLAGGGMRLPEPFPPGLDKHQRQVLESAADSLLSRLGLCEVPSSEPRPEELAALRRWFCSNGLLGLFFAHAMACWRSERRQVERFQPHVLAAAIHDLEMDRRVDGAKTACRRIRKLHEGRHPELFGVLDELPDSDSRQVLDWLSGKCGQLRGSSNPTDAEKSCAEDLGRFKSLLERYVLDRVRTQERDAQPTRHSRSIAALGAARSAPDSSIGERHDFYDDRPHRSDDVECATAYVSVNPETTGSARRSGDLQRYRAAAITQEIASRQMMSPVAWGVLSEWTLTELVRELRAGVSRKSVEDAFLTISLMTGRDAERLLSIPAMDVKQARRRGQKGDVLIHGGRDGSQFALRSELSLPKPEVFRELYIPAQASIDLPLPTELLDCLDLGKGAAPDMPAVKRRVAVLRKRLPQITLARISDAGKLWSFHNGTEATLAGRVFGTDIAYAVALHYENMAVERVLGVYGAWVDRINLALEKPQAFTVGNGSATARVGSRRCPNLEVLGECLRQYREFVRRLLAHGKSLAEAHNHFATYTYLVLAFGTGIRPVRQPFESLAEYCVASATYFIADKESRRGPSPRFVALPAFAVTQLEFYFEYLRTIKGYLDGDPKARRYMNAVSKGEAAFLFTLTGPGLTPTPLTPSGIARTLGESLPLVWNWPRHLMRTELANRGVPDEVNQAVMGHGQSGQEPFAHFSALSMADLDRAAGEIGEVAAQLQFEPLPGVAPWNRNAVNDGGGGDPALPILGEVSRSGVHTSQSDRNAERRKQEKRRQISEGSRWAEEKCKEAGLCPERFRDPNEAEEWIRQVLSEAAEKFDREHSWGAARGRLCDLVDKMNWKFNLAIPVPPPPIRLRAGRGMRTRALFNAQRVMQRAAGGFLRALEEPEWIHEQEANRLLPLVLFSAACFGGLAEPKALLALGRWLQRETTPVLSCAREWNLCWTNLSFESRGRNNVVDNGRPRRLRRFFVDGTTLLLLARYLKERGRAAGTAYKDHRTLMGHIRRSLGEACGVDLPDTMSLRQLCRGAVTVAERRPGVELPNYLAEFACGDIESVSVPEDDFRHYIGVKLESRPVRGSLPAPPTGLRRGHVRARRGSGPQPA